MVPFNNINKMNLSPGPVKTCRVVVEEKAKAAVGAIPVTEEVATKRDLEKAIGELKRELAIFKFGYGPLIVGLLIKIAFFDWPSHRARWGDIQ